MNEFEQLKQENERLSGLLSKVRRCLIEQKKQRNQSNPDETIEQTADLSADALLEKMNLDKDSAKQIVYQSLQRHVDPLNATIDNLREQLRVAGVGDYKADYTLGKLTETGALRETIAENDKEIASLKSEQYAVFETTPNWDDMPPAELINGKWHIKWSVAAMYHQKHYHKACDERDDLKAKLEAAQSKFEQDILIQNAIKNALEKNLEAAQNRVKELERIVCVMYEEAKPAELFRVNEDGNFYFYNSGDEFGKAPEALSQKEGE